MNLIPKIAEMLGVKIGEKFKVTGYGATYSFKEDGLCYYDKQRKGWYLAEDYVLVDILRDFEEIKKLPFGPKDGETYWYVRWGHNQCIDIGYGTWTSDDIDYRHLYCGNVFRTETEAEKHKYEIYEKLTGKKWVVAE